MHRRSFLQWTLVPLVAGFQSSSDAAGRSGGAPAVVAAAPPAELSGTDVTGRRLGLTDFPGHMVLVTFFTPGCNLCLHDLKLMREFYTDNRAKKFVLIGISVEETGEDVRAYSRILDVTVRPTGRFPMLWRGADGHVDSFGRIVRLPTHFVLDRSHRVVLERQGTFQPDDWDDLWTHLGGG